LGAASVMQKPISRQELLDSLLELGLFSYTQPQKLHVLIVDDDPRAVELMAVRMEGVASTVVRAFGGREAIDTARRELPDLILLDLMMPDVNGFDVVEALRGDATTSSNPIIIVTSKMVTPQDRAQLNSDVLAIMEKAEFDGERFATEVRRALWTRKSSA
jgi:CheY-like chemotaxis protein